MYVVDGQTVVAGVKGRKELKESLLFPGFPHAFAQSFKGNNSALAALFQLLLPCLILFYPFTFIPLPYLSIEMQMRIFPERKSPNILKKDMTLQSTSPAVHMTVAFHPISRGIMRNVTSRSAMARLISSRFTLDLFFL